MFQKILLLVVGVACWEAKLVPSPKVWTTYQHIPSGLDTHLGWVRIRINSSTPIPVCYLHTLFAHPHPHPHKHGLGILRHIFLLFSTVTYVSHSVTMGNAGRNLNSGLCPGALTFKAEVLAPERPEAACVVIEYGNMFRTSGIQHRPQRSQPQCSFIFFFFPSTLSRFPW